MTNTILILFFEFFFVPCADNILYSGEQMRQNFEIGAKGRIKHTHSHKQKIENRPFDVQF